MNKSIDKIRNKKMKYKKDNQLNYQPTELKSEQIKTQILPTK